MDVREEFGPSFLAPSPPVKKAEIACNTLYQPVIACTAKGTDMNPPNTDDINGVSSIHKTGEIDYGILIPAANSAGVRGHLAVP